MDGLPTLLGDDVIREMLEVARMTPRGCIVEVGVYKGGSAWFLNELGKIQCRKVYLYDTFTGIPYQGPDDNHKVGDFGDTSYEDVRAALPSAVVVKGIFPQSAIYMPPIGFAHIDCDQYQSVYESAKYLKPYMLPGGVMWFDDYGSLAGAKRAVDELFPDLIRAKCNKVYVQF